MTKRNRLRGIPKRHLTRKQIRRRQMHGLKKRMPGQERERWRILQNASNAVGERLAKAEREFIKLKKLIRKSR